VSEYVEEIDEYPELIDMVAYPTEDDTNDKKFTYEEVNIYEYIHMSLFIYIFYFFFNI